MLKQNIVLDIEEHYFTDVEDGPNNQVSFFENSNSASRDVGCAPTCVDAFVCATGVLKMCTLCSATQCEVQCELKLLKCKCCSSMV